MRKVLIILGLLSTILISCKVSYSFNGADICEQCKTVSVDLFEINSASANPQVAQIITESLKEKFNNETRLSVVNKEADLSFTGSITQYELKTVAVQGNQSAAMNRLTIGISVQYYNKHEPEKNFDKNFSRYADYSSDQNFDAKENELIEQIKTELIQDIFNNSVVNW